MGPKTNYRRKPMKKLSLAVFAALTLVAMAPAQGHKMMPHPMQMKHEMTVTECCMQNLSPSEKKMAAEMMSHGTPAQHEVMMKRCSMCMKDPHTAMKHMDMSKVTEKMKMAMTSSMRENPSSSGRGRSARSTSPLR